MESQQYLNLKSNNNRVNGLNHWFNVVEGPSRGALVNSQFSYTLINFKTPTNRSPHFYPKMLAPISLRGHPSTVFYTTLLHLSQYAFLHVKPPWQPPNHFHLLLQIFGMHFQSICRPFQLFLLLDKLSNITYSSLLTLTAVQNLVRSNQLNVSNFVIQHLLQPLYHPQIPCCPSKGVPSERLRLAEVINFA